MRSGAGWSKRRLVRGSVLGLAAGVLGTYVSLVACAQVSTETGPDGSTASDGDIFDGGVYGSAEGDSRVAGESGPDSGFVVASDGSPEAAVEADVSRTDGGIDAGPMLPAVLAKSQVCKLINNQSEGDPTANQTPTLANLIGTDLGIPVEAKGTLYFFFGDSHGNKGIWQPGQSLPDAVGYSLDSATALAASPELLCSDLRFLTLPPGSSLGPTLDPTIVADFATNYMAPPSGQSIGQFVHNPSGTAQYPFPNLPGTFEVPSGAFTDASGALYLFYTTVSSPTDTTMEASYLAQWSTPSPQSLPTFNVLYPVDERADAGGAMYGDFVNVAAETANGYVYAFGTGDYRKSPVHLARKALTSLGTDGTFELYDAASGTWGTARGAPIVTAPGYGETSVRYFPSLSLWMFLAEDLDGHNQIVARFAERPEGPWSSPTVVNDMADPVFQAQYCCTPAACVGQQMIHCNQAGFYGAYLLPEIAQHPDGSFTVLYTMSTWDPYNVVLMQATFSQVTFPDE